MLTLDEVQRYIATRGIPPKGESLIERIYANRDEVTKSLARTQAYQARKYNKSHRDLNYKVGQKFWLRVKKITIEQPSQKLNW